MLHVNLTLQPAPKHGYCAVPCTELIKVVANNHLYCHCNYMCQSFSVQAAINKRFLPRGHSRYVSVYRLMNIN
ncbi:MAG: hypothetical protein K0R82_1487 [Flavipsychrobacter sp.]|jgi:hypothetical protein|nr:hypothetical protein [Flavipsychrobacter sp.]